MESSRFNQCLNSNVQGGASNQVTHAPLSDDELARVFPGLNIRNVETSLFNLINLIHHLWGNHAGAFRANAQIPKPSNKQLILALLNLVNGLSVATADKLLKFCMDETYTEDGVNFKRICDCLLDTDYVRNPITSDQFNKYINNNQENDDPVATLIENIIYSTASARKVGIDTLLRLLLAPSKNIDYLKYLLEAASEFAFVENDSIDKESMQKLAQQLDQHVYKQNDVIVALVDKIKSKIPQIKVEASAVEPAVQPKVANTRLFMYKYSELYSALQDGDVVKVCSIVIRILNDKSLSNNEKIDLLYAKDRDGNPWFYVALFKGHAEAIKQFITLVLNADSSILTPANKLELLLAKSIDGFPGFYLALRNGHAEAVKQFITLILNADSLILTPANKLELLLAKSKSGDPGFFWALFKGHAEAVKQFINLVLNADSSILTPANKLELLLAKSKDGDPGLSWALYSDHASAVKEFITLVLNANSNVLTLADKLELLSAKNKYGSPGLCSLFSYLDDRSTMIEVFLELILNSNVLNAYDKVALLSDKQLSHVIHNASNRKSIRTFKNIIKRTTKLNQEQKNQILNPLRSWSEKFFGINN